jgi:hypothetical protein
MTCQHIIRDFVASRHTLCVSFAGNATEYEAKILHQHERTDIAIIRVFGTNRKYPALRFGDAEDVPAGTNVCMLGYIFTGQTVRALNPGVCPGKTSAPPQIRGRGLKDVVFTSTGNAGLSGSPVMVGDKVIGVMFCSLIQVLHARSSETINGLLKHLLHVAPNVSFYCLSSVLSLIYIQYNICLLFQANKSTEEMIDLLPVPV